MNILNKKIDRENSNVLYSFKSENFEKDWDVKSGEWHEEAGWLIGKNPENAPGMIVSKNDFFGNVMLEFTAATVLPCTHDIDCMWNGSWDEETGRRGVAYVAGLEGWWEGKVGFEKSPEYALNAATPLFDFEPGREYRIVAGSIDGHVFVFIDGQLCLEVTDPDPIDPMKYGKVGFEAYCSHIKVKDILVKQIAWEERRLSYQWEENEK